MTRNDFHLIAVVVDALPVDPTTRRDVAEAFAAVLATTNARFDPARFIAACQVSADRVSA